MTEIDVLRSSYEKALATHQTVEVVPGLEENEEEEEVEVEEQGRLHSVKTQQRKTELVIPLPPSPPPIPPPFPSLGSSLKAVLASGGSELSAPNIESINSNEELQNVLQQWYDAGYATGTSQSQNLELQSQQRQL